MYKFRLLPISLLTLVCLITSFVSSKLLATTLPTSDLPVLSSQAFKDKVNDHNERTQNGLCAALGTLLGLNPPASPPGCSTPNSNVPPPLENTAAYSDTSSQPPEQPSPATNSHTTSPQLNLYAN